MIESEHYRTFELLIRRQRFEEAARILIEYCSIGSEAQIVAVLQAAYLHTNQTLDFSQTKGTGSKSVENAIQRMRHPPHQHQEKHHRRNHNLSLKPKSEKDGRHKQKK